MIKQSDNLSRDLAGEVQNKYQFFVDEDDEVQLKISADSEVEDVNMEAQRYLKSNQKVYTTVISKKPNKRSAPENNKGNNKKAFNSQDGIPNALQKEKIDPMQTDEYHRARNPIK